MPSKPSLSPPALARPLPPYSVAPTATATVGRLGLPLWAALLWLFAPAAMLLAAACLQVGEQRQVLLPWLGYPLPETCAMYSRLGIDCPGCGLTRCFIHLAHGEMLPAWQLSPVGLLVFLFVVLQLPLALFSLLRVPGRFSRLCMRWNQFALLGLLAAVTVQWLWRLSTGDLWG